MEVRVKTWSKLQEAVFTNGRRPAYRIIIPAELKWEVRDKLDQANGTELTSGPLSVTLPAAAVRR